MGARELLEKTKDTSKDIQISNELEIFIKERFERMKVERKHLKKDRKKYMKERDTETKRVERETERIIKLKIRKADFEFKTLEACTEKEYLDYKGYLSSPEYKKQLRNHLWSKSDWKKSQLSFLEGKEDYDFNHFVYESHYLIRKKDPTWTDVQIHNWINMFLAEQYYDRKDGLEYDAENIKYIVSRYKSKNAEELSHINSYIDFIFETYHKSLPFENPSI